jgi:hypothetical protein
MMQPSSLHRRARACKGRSKSCFAAYRCKISITVLAMLTGVCCLWTCITSTASNAATVGATSSGSDNAVTIRGDEALKLLVGNTLRSVGDKRLVPEYRYFMSERFEYRCDGWDPVNFKRSDIHAYREAAGCLILYVSVNDGRLCESHEYETCQDHEFTLTFHRRSKITDVEDGQVLGRVTLPITDTKRGTDPIDHDLIKGDYDLVKGNATIFPDFNPAPKADLIRSDAPDVEPPPFDVQGCNGERRLSTLSGSEGKSKIVGNTLVLLDRNGKFDGRTGVYYDPDGRIIVIKIPAAPGGASLLHPSAEIAGSIFVNRWRIENGEMCRTENDEPTKFLCNMSSVLLQKPNDPGNQAAPRFCLSHSAIGNGFIARGNPFAVDFSRATEK